MRWLTLPILPFLSPSLSLFVCLVCSIDVWEHAYYLLRGPDRGDYISAWWDVVDLAKVEEAFARVTAS